MRTKNELVCAGIFLLIVMLLSKCASKNDETINYLGQTPPGLKAEVFAPGIVSTNANEHSALAFSPDGSVLLWAVMDSNYRGRLLEMKFENGEWSNPAPPSFADTTSDDYAPSFSPDGKKLFFSSRRKTEAGYREGRGNRIWFIDKNSDQWGIATPIDSAVSRAEEFSHSISEKGTLFFSSALDGKNMDIHKAEMSNDGYNKPTTLPAGINTTGYEDGPYISPDETFLIFESTRTEGIENSHDLYISFKKENGEWGKPVNMGPKINSASMERFPRLSPDGKYLLFASNRDQSAGKVGFDFYWIDAQVIQEVRAASF